MKKLLLWGIPTVAVIGLVIWRFALLHVSQAQVAGQRGASNAPEVQVVAASSRLIVQKLQGVGDIESPQKVEVSPKSAGRIDYLNAREGDVVVPGQLLLKIDPSDLKGAMLQQQANLAEARARLAQAKLTQNSNRRPLLSLPKLEQVPDTTTNSPFAIAVPLSHPMRLG
ncbi:MAG: biotin/lipoyl-binding protein [Fimbriimonas sp.]|nr:biotin/lipoyl-binding protein [Fimbriimonas sp.]